MPYIIQHIENEKFVTRKGVLKNAKHRLSADLGSAQLFNTVCAAERTIRGVGLDYQYFKRLGSSYYADAPEPNFVIRHVSLKLGDPV